MPSAHSEIANSARKIHSDHKPRVLRRKFCSRRRLIGESQYCAAESPVTAAEALESGMPGLAPLEVDARIDQRVREVADDLHQQAEQGEEIERREHHGIIAVDRGL